MSSLPTTFDKPVHIAIIGGTGLAQLDGFQPVAAIEPDTPWGRPSAPIQILSHGADTASDPKYVAFLARHGTHHQLAPHEVPTRANIAALRRLGVRCVVAFSAVGSLREDIRPMDFVLPDQVIDRTRMRPSTFFEGGVVGHVGFADPFDRALADVVRACASSMEGEGVVLHDTGTLICMEGPQFSTRAESHMYRSWGGSVINMSTLPEAKLAREAELAYQVICMATDYDCWRSAEDVSVEMVMRHMQTNGLNARRLVAAVLDRLSTPEHAHLATAVHWQGSVAGAVKFMTKPAGRGETAMKNVEYLFPGFWES